MTGPATEYLAAGYAPIRIAPGAKRPLDPAWQRLELTPERALAVDEHLARGGSVGLRMGLQPDGRRLVALDEDEPGALERAAAELGVLPPTLAQRTRSGGQHRVFAWPAGLPLPRGTVRRLPGVDIRSEGGQIVVAPSPGYSWLTDVPPAELPQAWAQALLGESRASATSAPTNGAPGAALFRATAAAPERLCPAGEDPVAFARRLARFAPPAVEGQGGHTSLFSLAADLTVGLGLTAEQAYDVLALEYNPRCEPPWDLDDERARAEFARKITEAGLRAERPSGYLLQPRALPREAGAHPLAALGRVVDLAEPVRPIDWVIDDVCAPGKTSLLVARPEGGKSPLALWMALCSALGRHVFEGRWQTRQSPVIYLDYETGDLQVERLQRMCNALGVERQSVPLHFVHAETELSEQTLATLADACTELGARQVYVDTYAAALPFGIDHNAAEFGHWLRRLGRLSAIGVVPWVLAHARKNAGDAIDAMAGNFAAVGAAQTVINLTPNDSGQIQVACARSPRKKWAPFWLEWRDIDEASAGLFSGVSLSGVPWGLEPSLVEPVPPAERARTRGNEARAEAAQGARSVARVVVSRVLQRTPTTLSERDVVTLVQVESRDVSARAVHDTLRALLTERLVAFEHGRYSWARKPKSE